MTDQIDQIRRAHKSVQPKPSNPAFLNCHHDCGVLLAEIERLNTAIRLDIDDAGATCGGVMGRAILLTVCLWALIALGLGIAQVWA